MIHILLSAASAEDLQYRVLTFSDRPADCAPLEGRFGQCVEEVDMLDINTATPEELKALSWGYALQWEELGNRWISEELTPLSSFFDFPMSDNLWEATSVKEHYHLLPASQYWITDPEDLYAAVRNHGASIPELTILDGRFVVGLGYNGSPFPYDVMDATSERSAPFYEQLYPFAPKLRQENIDSPLSHFASPLEIHPHSDLPDSVDQNALNCEPGELVLPDVINGGWTCGERIDTNIDAILPIASAEFDFFYSSLSSLIARYASGEFTNNHMNILAALTLMAHPPAQIEAQRDTRNHLVAASLGQTDRERVLQGRFSNYSLKDNSELQLNTTTLPRALVKEWTDRIYNLPSSEPLTYATIEQILAKADVNLRPETSPPQNLSDSYLEDWLSRNLVPGTNLNTEKDRILQAQLDTILRNNTSPEGNELRNLRILNDHFAWNLSKKIEGSTLSPAALSDTTASIWTSTLQNHGEIAKPFEQSIGRINPIAICTTKKGEAALKEEVIKPISIDLFLAGDDKHNHAYEVLWENAGALPFLLIDDPQQTPVSLDKIAHLPNERALFRVQWTVWSGWHLLWGLNQDEDNPLFNTLQPRTAALCEHTTFTVPNLLPTLLHASLLDGNFLSTTPATLNSAGSEQISEWTKKWEGEERDDAPFSETARSELKTLMRSQFTSQSLTMILESDPTSIAGLEKGVQHSLPYQQSKGSESWIKGWSWYWDEEPTLFPKRIAQQTVQSKTPFPLWSFQKLDSWMLNLALGTIPAYQYLEEEGYTWVAGLDWVIANANVSYVNWLGLDPKWAWELSSGALLDLHRQSLFGQNDEEFKDVYVQAEFLGGARWMPSMKPLMGLSSDLWGPSNINSKSRYSRYQYGILGGVLLGQGFEEDQSIYSCDDEYDSYRSECSDRVNQALIVELWGGRSPGTGKDKNRALRPYLPLYNVGPYIRFEHGVNLLNLSFSPDDISASGTAVHFGLKTQIRLSKPIEPTIEIPTEIPEAVEMPVRE